MDLSPFCLQLLDDPNINIEELVSVSLFASLPSVDGLEPDYRVNVTSPYRPLFPSVTGSRTSKSIVVSHCHKVYTISAWCRSFAVCEILLR